jgi:hypothetical protein
MYSWVYFINFDNAYHNISSFCPIKFSHTTVFYTFKSKLSLMNFNEMVMNTKAFYLLCPNCYRINKYSWIYMYI